MIIHIKDILEAIISRRKQLGRITLEAKIGDVWKEAAGEKAAGASEPVNVKNGVLTVSVANSTWLQELSLQKRNLIDQVNKRINGSAEHLKDIRFLLRINRGGRDGKKETS